jgi:hypothetical protein
LPATELNGKVEEEVAAVAAAVAAAAVVVVVVVAEAIVVYPEEVRIIYCLRKRFIHVTNINRCN